LKNQFLKKNGKEIFDFLEHFSNFALKNSSIMKCKILNSLAEWKNSDEPNL